MYFWHILEGNLLLINCIFAVIVIFFERRAPKSVWAWLLLLFLLPGVGFLFYLLFGTDLRKRRLFRVKEVEDSIQAASRLQEYYLEEDREGRQRYLDLIKYNLKAGNVVLGEENDIDIFQEGEALFEAVLADLKEAKHFIHLEYYIIRDDALFARLRKVLEEKAAQGVEVRILYDAMGCRSVSRKMWKKLAQSGVEVAVFFPALLGRFHIRMNYRNHRKIIVIDNQVAYVGGFNIGLEYVGLNEKMGHWRDTHLRIVGDAVLQLQVRFLLDWNYAAGKNLFSQAKYYTQTTFGKRDFCPTQIITSGPDSRVQIIRDNYLRLIHKARETIYIQTPYFIPDEAVFEALRIACYSGVEVNIMFPCKPDHLFVYWATYAYIGDLVMAGAHCYTYDNGFLHAKGMIVDEEVFCYGTANLDIRSFALNFEVNVVGFHREKAAELAELFRRDLKDCSIITKDAYAARGLLIRLKEQVCRLLSPLL